MPKSDWELFNCSEQHEHDYVVSLYAKEHRKEIREYLKLWCELGVIKNSTHADVYSLIKTLLNFDKE